ncbi:flavodoxin family protein [Helicobacter didelphidarum]|uniref:Flavodoxin family protein n=1 Tax=Helicobacter didelphidarum TaxID=2040648 RepID=A0A3D8IMS7_9HELI|nr:NAD(P)H-dependent oxidoreductase [Helicobacter didelphidarum]RDU65881.1 flavodoxin family protein [Helicobacter didelphidarum]
MQTLLIFSHTYFQDSKVNKALLESAKSLKNVEIRNLNALYPNGKIDKEAEITLLKNADKIIFQFPLFWFSTPSLMKEWQDEVLTTIAYSADSTILKGKKFQVITTIGGAKSSYDGHHGYDIKTLLSPLESSFKYLGGEVLEPYCIFSASVENLNMSEYIGILKHL